MMNKFNKAAAYLGLFMIFPLLFGYINSGWDIHPCVKTEFSDDQLKEISTKFKFETASDENISVEYFPGVMQASTYLKVRVENVGSEAGFLSRFQGIAVKRDYYAYYDSEAVSVYEAEIFSLEVKPKDYCCQISFHDQDGQLNAELYISGYIPELKNIYDFSHDYFHAFFTNRMFMIPLIIECVIIIFLAGQIPVWLIRKRINSHTSAVSRGVYR